MNVAVLEQRERDARVRLTQGITILERLGIIDFNGHFSVRLDSGDILINSGSSVRSAISPDDFVAFAQRAVAQGVQLVGGCCGIELDHIRPLRDALPHRVA